MIKAYIDIETSGLSIKKDIINIIGILCDDDFTQFVRSRDLIPYYIDEFIIMHKPTEVVGYNSNRFDIPFMEEFGVETLVNLKHTDLMHTCHDLNLKGGLKKVEQILGIERKHEVLNFFQQTALWQKYVNNNDRIALNRLLKYNEDDVKNLPVLEKKLNDKIKKQEEKHEVFKKAYFKKLGITE